jgi:hypothetical protein
LSYLCLCLAVAFDVGAYAVFKTIAAREHDALWLSLFAAGLVLGELSAANLAGAATVALGIVLLAR